MAAEKALRTAGQEKLEEVPEVEKKASTQQKPENKSTATVSTVTTNQPTKNTKNKDNEKQTDIDNEILGSKPIVPHSCCYILEPDNW